jgi:hypothetical protein
MDLRIMQLICVFCFYIASLFLVVDTYNSILITIMYASAWMFLITTLLMQFDKEDKEAEKNAK